MNPFNIEIELPNEFDNNGCGKIRLAFQVPYMWFGFWQNPGVLGPRKLDAREMECHKRDVARKFAEMVADEILRCWPEEKEK